LDKIEAKKNIQRGKESRKSKDKQFNRQKKQNGRTNNDLQNTPQKTTNPSKPREVNSGSPEGGMKGIKITKLTTINKKPIPFIL